LRLLLDSSAGLEWERRFTALRAFLADQYADDVDVKFKQVELHNKLLDLFVDLPSRLSVPSRLSQHTKIQHLFASSSFPTRIIGNGDDGFVLVEDHNDDLRSGTVTLLLSDLGTELKVVVVEGAPGQGKSTLAQYICQVHRIRLLDKQEDLLQLPRRHKETAVKIPFKLDLRDFAAWLDGADPFAGRSDFTRRQEQRSLENIFGSPHSSSFRWHCI